LAGDRLFERVAKTIAERSVRWIALQITDIQGVLHQVTITSRELTEDGARLGFGKLDGSSIRGFKDISESDLVLKPILETFALTPFSERTARFLCQVYDTGGLKRLPRDPRWIAERLEEHLAETGLKALVSAEPEFYVFGKVKSWLTPLSAGYSISAREGGFGSKEGYSVDAKEGYYPAPPVDRTESIRREISETLEDYFNVRVSCHHHEVGAAGQAEVNIEASSPSIAADSVQTLKYVAKNVAAKHGLHVTFLPKPIYGDNGSGMHTHVSLWNGSINLFYDPDDEYAEISQVARYFIGGLIEHGRSLSAIVSPTVNSYKRLIPGYEAPVYLAWSKANRSAAIRIPTYHRGDASTKRIEYRPPDPSCNPYLAFAAIILAGLDGIRKKIDPGDPVDENIYVLSSERRRELGVKRLPATLGEAIEELESDKEYLKPVFTTELMETYTELKREEWEKVEYYVTPAEMYYYSWI